MSQQHSDSSLRQRMIAMLSRQLGVDPSLDVPQQQLRELAENARRTADDVGPFDFAHGHFMNQAGMWERMYFLRECETRGMDRTMEFNLSRLLYVLHCEIFDHTADTALQAAIDCEKQQPHRSQALLELANILTP